MDGTIIAGEERGIRQAVVYILSRILNPNAALVRNGEMADDASLPHPDTLSTVLDIFREDDICFVNQLLGRMEETHDYRFDDSEFVNVSLNLLVMVYRLKTAASWNRRQAHRDSREDWQGRWRMKWKRSVTGYGGIITWSFLCRSVSG